MSCPDIQRILQTCLGREAKEILLVDGRPPLLRFSDCVREMQIEPLTADDVIVLALDSLIPLTIDRQRMREFYNNAGFCRWDYPYHFRPETRFRVFIIKQPESNLAILTPIGPDVPEMEYDRD